MANPKDVENVSCLGLRWEQNAKLTKASNKTANKNFFPEQKTKKSLDNETQHTSKTRTV